MFSEPKVVGIMASGTNDNELSNHEEVLAKFDSLNYEVRFQKVCPSRMGVPMTRQRLHYVGVNRKLIPDTARKMEVLQAVWTTLVQAPYKAFSLDHFLGEESSADSTVNCHLPIPVLPMFDQPEKKKWVSLHKHIFEGHEAHRGLV